MATRSSIAYVNSNNQLVSVYCHWDGYLEHNGRILSEHYNTQSQVEALVSMGSMSSLGASIGKKIDFDSQIDSLPSDVPEQSKFHCRDRGEQLQIDIFETAEEMVDSYDRMGCEYFYIYGTDGEWYYSKYDAPTDWKKVSVELNKLKEQDELNV
jgi:hypothetical protein